MASNYRPEIDGLRALAVIPVIFFHSGLSTFPGGYVGVDVFFVISGYLITKILLEDIDNDRFSILNFYERRVRRIFPALFVVLACTAGVALFVMFANELYEFAGSVMAAAFFYSNYFFMFDAGYFAAPSETKPLLHIWSLAVEEQFYIVFPLFLFAIMRLGGKSAVAVSCVVLLASLVYSIDLSGRAPGDAFFSAPSRFWELLAGAVLAMLGSRHNLSTPLGNVLTAIGLALILVAIFAYTDATPFPGAAALAPVTGTMLIIYAGSTPGNLVASLLSFGPVRFIGLISYSLYLWHWPVLVFGKLVNIGPLTNGQLVTLWAITGLLSWLSWKFVETPYRRRRFLGQRKPILLAGVAAMVVTGASAQVVMNGNGFAGRFPDGLQPVIAAREDRYTPGSCEDIDAPDGTPMRLCHIGATDNDVAEFAVWGDSHGLALLPAIDDSARRGDVRGVFVGQGGCPPLIDVSQAHHESSACPDLADAFVAYFSEHAEIRRLIVVARWSIYAMGERYLDEDGDPVYIRDAHTEAISLEENRAVFSRAVDRTLKRLAGLGRSIVLVEQVPETEFDIPLAAARASILDRNIELRPAVAEYEQRNAFVNGEFGAAAKTIGLIKIRPQDSLCGDAYCSVRRNGIPIYSDSSHLTASFARSLAGLFDALWHESGTDGDD